MQENDEMLIFVMAYYHEDLLQEIATDDEKTNDYDMVRMLKKLCKEFRDKKYDNEDNDLEENLKVFLEEKVEVKENESSRSGIYKSSKIV